MRLSRVVGGIAAAALLAGCGSGADGASGSSGSPSPRIGGTVTVFAAASLTGSFTELGRRFQAANPGVRIRFNFGPSSGLAQQILNGAPADVFASASTKNMDQVVTGGEASGPAPFASNVLWIAVPPDNPAKVASLADLARPGVKVALCEPRVPCGAVAEKVLDNAKVTVKPVTLGQDVKAVLTAVRVGEVDAGLVYATDVKAAGAAVTGIEIPAAVNATTTYPIAVTRAAAGDAAARAFVDYVLSAGGRAVLGEAGFAAP
jgi:molybdate transport system substrate-binding protein